MLREFLPETLVLPRNALGRNGNPGAYRTSPVESLNVTAGEKPFNLQREFPIDI